MIHFFNHLLSITITVLLLLCLFYPLRKNTFVYRQKFLRKILAPHKVYGFLLFIFSLLHGILQKKTAPMFSGKLAWTVLLLLIIFSLLKKKLPYSAWRILHLSFSCLILLLAAAHIIHSAVV